MKTIKLSTDVLRALGEGVSRLRDGDEEDCQVADRIDQELRLKGYILSGYEYNERSWDIVVSHLSYNGEHQDVLTPNEKHRVRSFADGFGETNDPALLRDWSHVRDSSQEAIVEMAQVIRKIRLSKRLPEFPA